jgi:hypothetical protein
MATSDVQKETASPKIYMFFQWQWFLCFSDIAVFLSWIDIADLA